MTVSAPLALATATLALALGSVAVAQTDPRQPNNDGSAAASATVPPGAVAEGIDPGTAAANATVQGNITAVKTANMNRRAQYQADLATYDGAVAQHGQQTAHYRRQQRAYADAMAAWRVQVAACQKGHQVACKAPAPDPANYM